MTSLWTFPFSTERWQKPNPWILNYEEARGVFCEKETGITFLDEGIHSFHLQNGALLKVYASPYTPSCGDWGFQYHRDHRHDFEENVDIVMTHGPPKGIMDRTHSGQRAGCEHLFKAIARAQHRPLIHCFAHIHEGWGGKLVRWAGKLVQWREKTSPEPSHLIDIHNEQSVLISTLSIIKRKGNTTECSTTSHCPGDSTSAETRLRDNHRGLSISSFQ